MIFRGIFADINEQVYWVDFITGGSTSGTPVEITLGESPCVITSQSSGLFDPMKPSTCTIQIVTKTFIPDLYTADPHGIEVKVIHKSNTDEIEFHGYVTPCMYTSSYTYIDTIEIEAVDALSTLQYYDFTYSNGSTAQNVPLMSILKRACTLAGYKEDLRWVETFNNYSIESDLCINEGNFFDDDEEHSPWKWYEVVEEICKFLGWSCIPQGDKVYFVDYRYIANVVQYGTTPWTYKSWTVGGSYTSNNPAYGWKANWDSLNLPIAAGRTTLALDEVFNKITISANTYNIDKFIPKVDNVNDHISINKEQNDFDYSAGVSTTSTYKTWFWGKKKEKYSGMPGYWSAYCRLDETKNWTHTFYNIRSGETVSSYKYDNYHDPRMGNLTSVYQGSPANRMINTVGAIPCHYSFDSDNASSVSWNDCLMVLKYNDLDGVGTRGAFKLREDSLAEKPILTYENNDSLIFKPATGTTWITIKGDLFFQKSQRVYVSNSNYNSLFISNSSEGVYATVPFDGEVKVGEQSFDSEPLLGYFDDNNEWQPYTGTTRTSSDNGWKTGFELMPMRVQLGDKYWNGSSWQSIGSTSPEDRIFYVCHTNEPDDDKKETVMTLKWMKIVPNYTYVDKVNESAYAIPIAYNDSSAPSCGTLKIEVMCPRMIPKAWHDLWPSLDGRHEAIDYSWTAVNGFGPCVFIKGFECNIVYTDTSVWWMDKADSDTDIVYSNDTENLGDTYITENDGLELKINTAVEEKPISKSFISNGTKYIRDMNYIFTGVGKPQEENLIDMYYDHYSNPCKEFTVNVRYRVWPFVKATFGSTISGEFVYDSQTWDMRKSISQIKFIEYKSDID